MIKTKVTINGIEYTIRAKSDQEVHKAVEVLREHHTGLCAETTDLELELNQSFDQLLQDIESGDVVLPSRVHVPEFEVPNESATETTAKPSKFKQRLKEKQEEAARMDSESQDSTDL